MARRRPSDYRPPVRVGEFVQAPEAEEDERIDVGVCFVGGGPAGLAGALRLAQLLEADPATAEKLGDTPIAVLDKGRVVGAHLLSGAVVNPSALRHLLPGEEIGSLPGCYGEVRKESVYIMRKGWEVRIPTPPPFHNKGNFVFSLSQLGRHLAERAEEMGVMVLPETDAQKLLVRGQSVVGVRTGDKGLDRDGQPLGSFEPGVEVHAQTTVLSEGTQGHLAGALFERFRVHGDMPQVWSLGVKEVWRVDHPLDRVVHTLGWPFRLGGKWKELGGSFIYPMGEDMLTIGLVCGLDTLDASLSVHDSLQLFKTHPLIRGMLEGGERIGWGAKTIPEGGFLSIPHRLSVPGAIVTGDSAGFVNVPKLKGIHYAMRSGMLAAETIYEALKGGAELNTAALTGYDERVRRSHIWSDLRKVRNMRQALGKGMFVGAPIGGIMDITRGALPGGSWKFHRDAEEPVEPGSREYPAPDGTLTFDKLSSVFLSGNRSRDDQPNHIRVAESVPREVAEAWVAMCPAAVYEIDGDDGGPAVRLKLSPSNCVQCGAITARGGRLTPPEGGSGPEYTLT